MKTMRLLRSILLSAMLLYGLAAISQSTSNFSGVTSPAREKITVKVPYDPNNYPPPSRQGGENFQTAVVVTSLPYSDVGNTCGHLNDYHGCYLQSTSPDVVYSYTPSVDEWIEISLCGSSYDTKLDVYKNDVSNLLAESDDDCFWDPYDNGSSYLVCFDVHPGNVYYIVVDGFGGDCGEYVINISSCGTISTLASINCAVPEGEPDPPSNCENMDSDVTNGGCNSFPHIFQDVAIGEIIYGRGNIYNNGSYRDTDWYRLILSETKTLYWSAYSNFYILLYILQAPCPCSIVTLGYGDHTFVSISATLPPGEYYFTACPAEWTPTNEGEYLATLTEEPVSSDPSGWCGLVPISNWAIFLAAGLIIGFAAFILWRKR